MTLSPDAVLCLQVLGACLWVIGLWLLWGDR